MNNSFPSLIDYFIEYSKSKQIDIFEKQLRLVNLFIEFSPKERAYVGRNLSKLIKSHHFQNISDDDRMTYNFLNDLLRFLGINKMKSFMNTESMTKAHRKRYSKICDIKGAYVRKMVNNGLYVSTMEVVKTYVNTPNRLLPDINI